LEEEEVDYGDSPVLVDDSSEDGIDEAAGFPVEKETQEDGVKRLLRSVVVKPTAYHVSYKDAFAGVRTFKPRFNASTAGEGGWSVERRSQRGNKPNVWARLGGRSQSIHERLGRKVSSFKERLDHHPPKGSLLQLLKAKAANRCFNCFARDHRIAQCRDPPRCIRCSRSGPDIARLLLAARR